MVMCGGIEDYKLKPKHYRRVIALHQDMAAQHFATYKAEPSDEPPGSEAYEWEMECSRGMQRESAAHYALARNMLFLMLGDALHYDNYLDYMDVT